MEDQTDKLGTTTDFRIHNVSTPPTEHLQQHDVPLAAQKSADFGATLTDASISQDDPSVAEEINDLPPAYDPRDHGIRRIIRNFTPSWVISYSEAPLFLDPH